MNASAIVNKLLEAGPEPLPTEPLDPRLDRERYLDAQRRGEKTYTDFYGQTQPVAKPDKKKAAGRNSVTMSRNRNLRARSFGAPRSQSNYSVRDRGWPT